MKHLFIINPVSFLYNNLMDSVVRDIKNCFNNESEYAIHLTRYSRDSYAVIRKYVSSLDEIVRVYAVGGDGTLFSCLNGVMGLENAELASVPYGNSNDFVRSFGSNKFGLFKDFALQIKAKTIPTDVIFCGNNYAINYCSVGLEAKSINPARKIYKTLNEKNQRISYSTSHLLGGIISVLDSGVYKQYYYVTIDGESYDGYYSVINIANGSWYGGGMRSSLDAIPNDGILDVTIMKKISAISYLRKSLNYTKGGFNKYNKNIIYRRAKEITIRSDTPISISLDGETYSDTNINLKVVPSAVKLVSASNTEYTKMGV